MRAVKFPGGNMVNRDDMSIQARYAALSALIAQRQQFEKENPRRPYSTHPTTLAFRDIHAYSLLDYAVMLGDLDKVNACLSADVDVNATSPFMREKPIALALQCGHLDVAKRLYEKGADCSGVTISNCGNKETREWYTALAKAALQESFPDKQSLAV